MRSKTVAKAVIVPILLYPWLGKVIPVLPELPLSAVVNLNLAGEYTLIAASLVVLTGWVGQISLGHGTFVGIGAFTTGLLVRQAQIPFPVNLPIVALIAGLVAGALGLVALRVRGLYLAVATLIFAWMADAYLFTAAWFVGKGGSSSIESRIIGRPNTLTAFDLSDKRVFYLVILAAVATTLYLAINLRDSKTGRAFFAIRGSEMAAVSLGIDITRYKLMAFAISGALAGIAGNLIIIDQRTVSPSSFQFTVSLFYLSVAVIGGITSLPGALAASALFAGLNELFFRVQFLQGWLDIVAVGLLLAVLLLYPGGLGAVGSTISSAASPWIARTVLFAERTRTQIGKKLLPPRERAERRGRSSSKERSTSGMLQRLRTSLTRAAPAQRRSLDMSRLGSRSEAFDTERATQPQEATEALDWRTYQSSGIALKEPRNSRSPVLEADNIVVRFGGLVAANGVSIQVRENEIVGLIGPNGAGKTTCFNAISGLNQPTSGTIKLFGQDATDLPVHLRAQMGVGRTFQLIQLFPQLSVFDNLLVATHVHNPTGLLSHLLLTESASRAEVEARAQVRLVIGLLKLKDVADRLVAGLPFGILRQVEIARALVTRAPFLMLDEPASGLDNAETEELTKLLYFIRAELGVSILLIEHDVKMVTGVSDYMYVINRGVPLADGTPLEVQRNPEVIAAYLGESELEPA